VEVRREPLPAFSVGDADRVHYMVRNKSRWLPVFGLSIQESPGRRPSAARAGIGEVHAVVLHVAPGGATLVDAPVAPRRRGEASFDLIRVSTRFPLGIIRRSVEWRSPATSLVRPRVAPPPRSVFAAAVVRASLTGSPVAAIGRSAEFHSLRPYRHGDSPRQIAWRATARTGELVVRENTATAPARLIVGMSLRSVGKGGIDGEWERDAERAVELAAGLVAEALLAGMDTGLSIPAGGVRRRTTRTDDSSGAGGRMLGALLDDLALLDTRSIAGVTDVGLGATVVIHTWRGGDWAAPAGVVALPVDSAPGAFDSAAHGAAA